VTASLDDLVSMAVFARVVEARSFTGAATALGLSKSVVSARVAALEERLGVRLLHRTTRRLTLTEDGARLHEKCARMVAAADEASEVLQSVGTEPEGVVRVTAPVGVGLRHLPGILREMAEQYPKVRVEVSLAERTVDLVAEGFDVAIRVSARLTDSTLVARRCGTERMVVCGAPSYFARHGVPASPHDLAHHNCMRLSALPREWTFRSGKQPLIVPVSGSLVVDNISLLHQAAIDGVGLAMLPAALVAADLSAERLRRVLAEHSLGESAVWVLHPYGKHVPAKVRAFVDQVVAHFRALE
jgi:DNA-binding transcriptional LysR family regulator